MKVVVGDNESSHVLDLQWSHQSDILVLSLGTISEMKNLTTQRIILCLLSALIDLSGLVAHYTAKTRFLVKKKDLASQWPRVGRWITGRPCAPVILKEQRIAFLESLVIPRNHFEHDFSCLSLHMFGVSSQNVLSAVTSLQKMVRLEQIFVKNYLLRSLKDVFHLWRRSQFWSCNCTPQCLLRVLEPKIFAPRWSKLTVPICRPTAQPSSEDYTLVLGDSVDPVGGGVVEVPPCFTIGYIGLSREKGRPSIYYDTL